jgi:HAL2 family 3'(2'),5'-bisphosphate nucleotidase
MNDHSPTGPASLDSLALAASEAVHRAARVTRAVQGRLAEIAATAKDDRSPVTVADFASQAVVTMVLRRRLPSLRHALIAEESADLLRSPAGQALLAATVAAVREAEPDADAAATLDAIAAGASGDGLASTWTLDPVDGTKGFLRNGQYAIALARLEGGSVTLAALGCPALPSDPSADVSAPDATGSIFLAARGRGAFEVLAARGLAAFPDANSAAARRIASRPWSSGDPLAMCESVESGHSDQDLSRRMMGRFGPPAPPLRLDSQAKYAVVARGQAHAYLRLPTRKGYVERIWDHAAGSLLATEAGCRVGDVDGKPLDFGHGRGLERNRGVICASPSLFPLLVSAYAEATAD